MEDPDSGADADVVKLMGGDFVSMLDVEADACDVVVAKRLALA